MCQVTLIRTSPCLVDIRESWWMSCGFVLLVWKPERMCWACRRRLAVLNGKSRLLLSNHLTTTAPHALLTWKTWCETIPNSGLSMSDFRGRHAGHVNFSGHLHNSANPSQKMFSISKWYSDDSGEHSRRTYKYTYLSHFNVKLFSYVKWRTVAATGHNVSFEIKHLGSLHAECLPSVARNNSIDMPERALCRHYASDGPFRGILIRAGYPRRFSKVPLLLLIDRQTDRYQRKERLTLADGGHV